MRFWGGGTKKFYGWVRMGDNATISLLRSTIMSNVSCPYPPDHSPITSDQRLDVTSVTYLTCMPLLNSYLNFASIVSYAYFIWAFWLVLWKPFKTHKTIWNFSFRRYSMSILQYSQVQPGPSRIYFGLVVIISVLADLSTMIRRDEVSSDSASHPSIFPRHPHKPSHPPNPSSCE